MRAFPNTEHRKMPHRKNITRRRVMCNFLLAASYIIIIIYTTCAHEKKTVSAFSTPLTSLTAHRQRISTITGRRRKIRIKALSTEQDISISDEEISNGEQQQQDTTTTAAQQQQQHNTQNYSNGILSSVQSLARIAGSAGNDLVSDPNNKGSSSSSSSRFGMPFSSSSQQRTTTSRRSQLIEWQRTNLRPNKKDDDTTLITTALKTLERDMALLDNVASQQSQLSGTEVGLLAGAVLASGIGPIVFPGTSVTELLAPAAAACELCILFLLYMYAVLLFFVDEDPFLFAMIIVSSSSSSSPSVRFMLKSDSDFESMYRYKASFRE